MVNLQPEPNTDAWRILLFGQHGDALLVLRSPQGFRLPELRIPSGQRVAPNLNTEAKRQWNVDTVCLMPLNVSRRACGADGGRYHTMEVCQPGALSCVAPDFIQMSGLKENSFADPQDYKAYMELGKLSAARHDPLAEQFYNTALELRPRSVEAWLRERQVARAGDVLVITGRGNNSANGVSPVRQGVAKRLTALKRQGVVDSVGEHSPGSFVVTLAPISALFEAPKRGRHAVPVPRPDPHALEGLSRAALDELRALAMQVLDRLGAHTVAEPHVTDEMGRLFAQLSAGVPDGVNRDHALRSAVAAALDDLDAR